MADTFTKDEEQAWQRMAASTVEKPAEAPEREEAPSQPEPEETEPEGISEAPEASEAPPEATRTVPINALHEERSRRQELERENRRLAEERALFDGRLQAVLAMQREREQPPPPEPDEMTDPIGAIGFMRQRLANLESGGQRQNEILRQQAQQQQLYHAANADAVQFRQQQPDYGDAYEYFKQHRANELLALGYNAGQARDIIGNEEMSIAVNAFRQGVSPAATLYNVARARGYQSRPANGNGASGAADNASREIQRINQGQSRSRTLSGTGGGATPTEMTADQLLRMSAEEFDAWTTKNPRKAKRLMGG